MLEKTLFQEAYFWDFLSFIQKHDLKRVTLEELKLRLNLSEEQLIQIVSFCHKLEYPVRIDRDVLGRAYLVISNEVQNVKIDLSFNEWLAYQAQLYLVPDEIKNRPFFSTLEEKINKVMEKYEQYNLYTVIEKEREKQKIFSEINNQNVDFIDRLDQAILNGICLSVVLNEKQYIDFYPLKMVVIDGVLSAVGEDRQEKCLVYFETSELTSVNLDIDEYYQSHFTKVEIEDFICAVRNVMGTEERLILKLKSQVNIDLNPPFQHLGKPFITSNMEGEIIWAASVERSEHLYQWLYSIKDNIEILDPQKIVDEFAAYIASIESNIKVA